MSDGGAAGARGFGVENLPYGVARLPGGTTSCVSALGDDLIDLAALARDGSLDVPGLAPGVLEDGSLNRFLACGRPVWEGVRRALAELAGREDDRLGAALVPRGGAELLAPVAVGDFVDFSASLHHATNAGRLFRPGGDPLAPHWRSVPRAYHGRAGSIVVTGTGVVRPLGQVAGPDGDPVLQPTAALDFEAEVGAVVGTGSRLGERVPAAAFADHVAGLVLVNDWSARDVQALESRPLGPFAAKSFATSVSPWLVTLAALEPYRVVAPPQEPPPPRHLAVSGNWAYDVRIEVSLQSERMRAAGLPPAPLSCTSFAALYWRLPQLLAHATVNGAPTRTGDLLASGTVSGSERGSEGSLLELAWGGDRPLPLPDGTTRTFLEDGDLVVVRAWAGGDDLPVVSFGEVTGTVLPATDLEV